MSSFEGRNWATFGLSERKPMSRCRFFVIGLIVAALMFLALTRCAHSAPRDGSDFIDRISEGIEIVPEKTLSMDSHLAKISFEFVGEGLIVLTYRDGSEEFFYKEDVPELWSRRLSSNGQRVMVHRGNFLDNGERIYLIKGKRWQYAFFAAPFFR